MTNTPPKPKRRRWPWLAVSLFMIAVCVAWYCYRPMDARVVGVWQGFLDDGTPGEFIEFASSGRFYTRRAHDSPNLDQTADVVLAWSVEDDFVYCYDVPKDPLARIGTYGRRILKGSINPPRSAFGWLIQLSENDYGLKQVNPAQAPPTTPSWTFRRLPE